MSLLNYKILPVRGINLIVLSLLLLFSVNVSGCAKAIIVDNMKEISKLGSFGVENIDYLNSSRIMPGDTIELVYYKSYPKDSEIRPYLIDIGDVLSISIDEHPELNQESSVMPDGYISLKMIDSYMIKGKSVKTAKKEINALYKKIFSTVKANVSLTEPQKKLQEFFSNIQSSIGGTTKEYPVTGQGYIELPYLESIKVVGETTQTLRKKIKTSYNKIFNGFLDVTINIKARGERFFYVLGEVVTPGVKPLNTSVNPLKAIAMAGGFSPDALTENILFMRFANNTYHYCRINLKQALENPTDPVNGLRLAPNDFLFVGKTRIAEVDKLVEQYLRKIVPFNMGLGLTSAYIMNPTN